MEYENAKKHARELMPIGSKVYCVKLRTTGTGNRLVRYLIIRNGDIYDATPIIGRVINKRVTPKEGGLWTQDPANLIATVGINLYREEVKPWTCIHFYEL